MLGEKKITKYLSKQQVARRIGMRSSNSLSGITLPPHDVEVGVHRGWLPSTIDEWHAERPGHGWWGGR